MTQVLSTNLFHILGRRREETKVFDSKFSMNRLAITGESGEPMTTPQVFSKNSPSNEKKVEVRQIPIKLAVSR